MLDLPDVSQQRSGALVAVYRYLGKNVKVGAGYNFTDFSDDLTDLNTTTRGVRQRDRRAVMTATAGSKRNVSDSRSRRPACPHPALLHVTPGVGAGAVEVGEAVDLRELAAGEGLPVPARAIRIGGERGDGAADEARRLRDHEMRDFAVASRQFSSVTPNASSIISERSQPGVMQTEVAPCGARSLACAQAMRVTATFARS